MLIFVKLLAMIVERYIFDKWPYDDALKFMSQAKDRVFRNPDLVIVASGSHCERVITLGRNPERNWVNPGLLKQVLVRTLARGGGPTAHEPGQLVLYPIINLRHFNLSVGQLITALLNTMKNFANLLSIDAAIDCQNPGLYVDGMKAGFLGLRVDNHVTQHGIAINVKNDLETFSFIDPCGVKGLPVTALASHVEVNQEMDELAQILIEGFLGEGIVIPTLCHPVCLKDARRASAY